MLDRIGYRASSNPTRSRRRSSSIGDRRLSTPTTDRRTIGTAGGSDRCQQRNGSAGGADPWMLLGVTYLASLPLLHSPGLDPLPTRRSPPKRRFSRLASLLRSSQHGLDGRHSGMWAPASASSPPNRYETFRVRQASSREPAGWVCGSLRTDSAYGLYRAASARLIADTT